MGFRLLLWQAMAGGLNMGESGFKVDPSSLKYPEQRFTNHMVAKSAREKRRKIMANRKSKRCKASGSIVVSYIKDPMVTQIAREKRRQIIAAKKAMRCTSSREVFPNDELVQSSQRTKTKEDKNPRSSDRKPQHETSGSIETETTSR